MPDLTLPENTLIETFDAVVGGMPFDSGVTDRLVAAARRSVDPNRSNTPRTSRGRRWGTPLLAAAAVVAVGAAVVAATGVGRNSTPAGSHNSSVALSSPPTPTQDSAPAPGPSVPLRTAPVTGAVSGTVYELAIWADRRDASCVGHTYGAAVTAYVASHPCTDLHRLLITTRIGGRQVAASIILATSPGTPGDPYSGARGLAKILTASKTGSINDLLREGSTFPGGASIPSDEVFKVYNQDAGAMIADLWYVDGPTSSNDATLSKLAQDILLELNSV
jgi:hypothetical protein